MAARLAIARRALRAVNEIRVVNYSRSPLRSVPNVRGRKVRFSFSHLPNRSLPRGLMR